MKIKDYYINDVDTCLELLIKEMMRNNVSYVLLKYEGFIELHYLNNICRFYLDNNLEVMSDELNFEPFNDLYIALRDGKNKKGTSSNVLITRNYVDDEISVGKVVCGNYSNERPGYKRYTKKNIRLDNKNSKTRPKIKR